MTQEETNLDPLWITPAKSAGRAAEYTVDECEDAEDLLVGLFEFAGHRLGSDALLLALWASQSRVRTELEQARLCDDRGGDPITARSKEEEAKTCVLGD